jgi:hypothetical protein
MDLTHSPRHTRRGFLRGDAAPKFYPVSQKAEPDAREGPDADVFRPPASGPHESFSGSAFPTPPQSSASSESAFLSVSAVPTPPQLSNANDLTRILQAVHELSFEPDYESSALSSIGQSLAAPTGNAFLSWLAEQLEGKQPDDFDPFVEFGAESLFAAYDDDDGLDSFGCEFESAYLDDVEEPAPALPLPLWHREEPEIELSPDGWRIEVYYGGSKIVKDALGRVVEVHSQLGESMLFRYGENGNIETFQRIRADGTNHSDGARDKHGVVVRDPEGRVRAAGESMTIDPRGSFFLHTFEGQFFSVDLVSGIHTERRKITDETGASRFVTSIFAHDGFRMATMFSGTKGSTAYGVRARTPKFRFYGRDGTMIEFSSEDDLQQLRPHKVLRPASRKISKTWPRKRQAVTAWDAVRDYLMRVG